MSGYSEWDEYYKTYPLSNLGWELGKPRPILVEYIKKGLIQKGKALDLCCGAGTNTLYLEESGFFVTGIDISKTAIRIAQNKSRQAKATTEFLIESFVDLAFRDEEFDFIFDMGCFHHVKVKDRRKFIMGVRRILRRSGVYMLTCFSYRNGQSWNHFTMQDLVDLFHECFVIGKVRHYSSLEGDGVVRFFYTVLMEKKS
jgi:2-polyprenyl-3-methyl-5-hydroxy-6-metoxy-1,4-benzoquinol methylase